MPHMFDLLDAAIFLVPVLFAAATLPLLINRAIH
jgi:hypothetical protein